jgi:NADH-quinone oxidoreductase subunit G
MSEQVQPELPPAGPDEVALLIDDRPVVVKKGTTVLQAAAKVGVQIPHFCYHAGLSIAGNCRMCLVEVEKMPKLQISCATMASQGMVVKTGSERVRATRARIMEFLLINHPLDCPICDQAGECMLQQYADAHGDGRSRFTEEKNHDPKRLGIGRYVVYDAERCIKCTRCVRFCDEVSRTFELGLRDRGDREIIGVFPGRPLDNLYSGNTVDICPVGALTWKPFRFKARVWFLKNVSSVCTACARGCNVNLATYQNRIHRITPRLNPEVNSHWMCDEGRLIHERLRSRPRLDAPLFRPEGTSGRVERVRLAEALDRAGDLLRRVASRTAGAKGLAAILSSRLTVEDLFMAREVLGGSIGIPRMAVPAHEEGEDDDLLIRRDKTPNSRGAALLGPGARDGGRMKELLEDVAAGRVAGLVVVGEDPVGDGLLSAEAVRSLDLLVVIDWWWSPTVEAAQVALPACGHGEFEGVFVNFEGRAQKVNAGIRTPGMAAPVWRLLRDLGLRFGLAAEYPSAAAVFEAVAAGVPAFSGLSYGALAGRGAAVKEI